MVIILDDDLIEFLQYNKQKVATLYGTWIEYLANSFTTVIQQRQQQLPAKAQSKRNPQLYWAALPLHADFSNENNSCREIFNACLESVIKVFDDMRILKLKELWDVVETDLVKNDSFTPAGVSLYWKVINASVKFNIQKHEEFNIRRDFRILKLKYEREKTSTKHGSISQRMEIREDPMPKLFKRAAATFTGEGKRKQDGQRKIFLPQLKLHKF